ncbi:MAG: DUF1203 domain-containing protein [Pseudomonadota bacterium]
MPEIRCTPIPTAAARALQAGIACDANGQPPERCASDGGGNPCRHCLRDIPAGAAMLVLAWRPFSALQPYAETGPVFLCADPAACPAWQGEGLPPILATSPRYMMRGYGADERIVYGSGAVVEAGVVEAEAARRLADPAIAFVHLRSASNGCFQCRVDRA